jgi:ABC-type uncharacterized transport system auxiliary subunit
MTSPGRRLPRRLDTTQIAVTGGTYRVRYYADAERADTAPIMVGDLLVQYA